MPNAVDKRKAKSITLELVSSGSKLSAELERKHAGGRPTKLTARVFVRICKFIEAGGTETAACQAEGIQCATLSLHVLRKPLWKKRLLRAREVRRSVWHELHIQNILAKAPKNVIASLWWLERNFPEQYALRTVQRNITSHELVLDKISPEQLAEDMRLAKEIEKERPQLGSGEVEFESQPRKGCGMVTRHGNERFKN
jgi:hypothetical protein